MAKSGTPPRWLEHVNRLIVALNRLGVGELNPAAAEPILRAWPERIPRGAKVMVDAGLVPDTSQESFARLAGSCAVFRVERA